MKVIRETAVAGKTIYRMIKTPAGIHTGKRHSRRNPTSESVRKNNERLSVRNLTLTLNANFNESGAHVTLTYDTAPSAVEAAKDRRSFIRKLRRQMKRNGRELKYVIVTEYQNKRIHHHMVLNTQDIEMINRLWKKGHVHITPLDSSGEYSSLAEYLVKETSKTFRDSNSIHHTRYSASRNLIKPVIKRELVSPKELYDDPEPIKGYYIPKDSIRRFEHPITEMEHLEYMMIALNEPRKYHTWPKGKPITGREHYRARADEQLELDFSVEDYADEEEILC